MFKKRLTPFACILLALAVCIVSCVATASVLSVRHKASLNEERLITAENADLINAVDGSSSEHTKLAALIKMIEQKYVNDVDKETFWNNLYRTLGLAVGDRYGDYYNAEDYEAITSENDGDFVGIGIRVSYDVDTDGIYVTGVMKDSPAQKGGMQVGDVIVKVEDTAVSYDSYNEVIGLVKGEAGTDVALTVLRGEEELSLTFTRAAVASENVIYENLGNGVAYINIITFSDTTLTNQFVDKLSQAQADGCDKFIFDVRNNQGGYLDTVVKVLDIVLPEGAIIHIEEKGQDGKPVRRTQNSDANCIKAEKMAVLCNQATASAAELFTAALRDYKLADIVGKTTFGKGTMQSHFPLNDGSVIKITTAYYYPPCGDNYDGVGITPDYEVELKEEWQNRVHRMPKEEDTQLQKAIELVTSTN